MALENGSLLNQRYRIVDILGQGGMGAVYRALDENLDIIVAVKENSFYSEEYARQFQREAQILASLKHPNLPRVYDYFVIDQQGQYLVMDFVEGEDLRQWMTREDQITESEALQIGIQISNALIYLHSRVPAIVHRDIKPGNVKITPSGEVMLVDFGLVKVLNDKEITTSAARAMTPGYSPPEQYGAAPTDHRSDIFSLGATLYAALAGYLPEDSLARSTGKSTLTPLREHNLDVSDQTASIIEKALSIQFDDRWQTAAEFKDALLSARNNLPLSQQGSDRLASFTETQPDQLPMQNVPIHNRSGWQKTLLWFKSIQARKDPVWLIFSLVIVALMVALIVVLMRPAGITALLGIASPSATTVVYTTSPQPPEATVVTGGMATEAVRQTPDPQRLTPAPTPRGGGSGSLAFVSERSGIPQIWLYDITTHRTTQLTRLIDGACQPDWSPEGDLIVFTSPCAKKRDRYPGSSLFILDTATGDVTPLPPPLEGDFDPAWSPDGRWIAFTSLTNGQMQLMKIDLTDFAITRLSDGSFDDSSPTWSSDGSRLAFVRTRGIGQIWLMDANGENALQFTRSGEIDNSNPDWYPQENLILFSQALGLGSPSKRLLGMRLEDLGQAEETAIIPGSPSDYVALMDNVAASPDGYWLVFDYWYSDVLEDIYLMAFPSANLIQLTDHPARDYDPVWRP